MARFDRDEALEIHRRGFGDFIALLGEAGPGSRLIERDGGIRAAVAPAAPERSIANSVIYRDAAELVAALDELAAAYREAEVNAWTVWVPEHDREAARALERAGHRLDASPAAMLLDLDRVGPADPSELDWDADGDLDLLGSLNDEAYGHEGDDGFAAALRRPPDGLALRVYRARVNSQPACVLSTLDHAPAPGATGPDCGIYLVATPQRFRGRGLATRLLAAALGEARERGCATSSLQATAAGEPIYRALGYETRFAWRMYERRART